MSNPSVNRRDFLKLMGMGASSLGLGIAAPKLLTKTRDGMLVESPSEYGGFVVEKLNAKNFPYEYDTERIKRMSEKSTTFSRNVWDPRNKGKHHLYQSCGRGRESSQSDTPRLCFDECGLARCPVGRRTFLRMGVPYRYARNNK